MELFSKASRASPAALSFCQQRAKKTNAKASTRPVPPRSGGDYSVPRSQDFAVTIGEIPVVALYEHFFV